MAACGSLQHIFEKPLPENPILLESLSSWKPVKPVEQNSFTEIFGELHFKENSQSTTTTPKSASSSASSFPISFFSSSPPSSCSSVNSDSSGLDNRDDFHSSFFSTTGKNAYTGVQKKGDGFAPMNYESLQLCTEGLGFESSDDVEDLKSRINGDWKYQEKEKVSITRQQQHSVPEAGEFRRSSSRSSAASFPPPISCLGKSGKPWLCFKSYRQDGRFVLKQVRIPTQELLHACREDGRLTLHFVQPNDDISEEDEDDEAGEEGDDEIYEDENDEQEQGNEEKKE